MSDRDQAAEDARNAAITRTVEAIPTSESDWRVRDDSLRRSAIDANASRAARSSAPPMRNDHLEIHRRLVERARKELEEAQTELTKAQARYSVILEARTLKTEGQLHAEHQAKLASSFSFTGTIEDGKTPASESALSDQVGGQHYKTMAIQPVEFIEKNKIPYLEGNAIKYICRHASKGGVQDLDKAIHYLQLLKEMRYGDSK